MCYSDGGNCCCAGVGVGVGSYQIGHRVIRNARSPWKMSLVLKEFSITILLKINPLKRWDSNQRNGNDVD